MLHKSEPAHSSLGEAQRRAMEKTRRTTYGILASQTLGKLMISRSYAWQLVTKRGPQAQRMFFGILSWLWLLKWPGAIVAAVISGSLAWLLVWLLPVKRITDILAIVVAGRLLARDVTELARAANASLIVDLEGRSFRSLNAFGEGAIPPTGSAS